MAKQTITQRSFTLGEVREDFLEADDLELRGKSLWKAQNVRIASTGTLKARPGTVYMRNTGASDLIEIRPSSGVFYGLLISDVSLRIIDASGQSIRYFASVPWTSASDVWVEPFSEETIIGGSFGLRVLRLTGANWTLENFTFPAASGGDSAQPFWVFSEGVYLEPSARTGTITLTASENVFLPAYVGLRVRYGRREILITRYINKKKVEGVVQSQLPPTFDLVLANATGFKIGDAVVGQTTNYQGLIVNKSGNTITVVTTEFFDGPDDDEAVSAPSATSTVTSKTEIAPAASPIWDEQLISPVRGYPRAGASAGGRLTLTDFPQVPDLICMSSTRNIHDFKIGAEDDDGILRQVGDNAPRFMHVVNSGDLLLFSDRGVYLISLRENALTPANFNPVLVDRRACNSVRPVPIGDGVVFVDASGQALCSAALDGNIYLKWSVRTITTYHAHLIRKPVKLCGPSLYSETPEKYLFVVNADGTLAAVSWDEALSADGVGFVPWETEGHFVSVSPIFGGYWAIVDRQIGETERRLVERFDETAMLDCQSAAGVNGPIIVNGDTLAGNGQHIEVVTASSLALAGAEVHVYDGGFYAGTQEIDEDGNLESLDGLTETAVVGFNFRAVVRPWPAEHVQSPRGGVVKARVVRGSVSVMHTRNITVRANRTVKNMGNYFVGDLMTLPPEQRTRRYGFTVIGHRDHPEIEITKEQPGEFQVLAITQETTL